MTIVVGDNSYVTLVEADEYFLTRYNSASWNVLDDTTKETLLISATRSLDLYCDWKGNKTEENQLLAFPRDDEATPENIKYAQCEIAFSILESNSVVSEREPNLTKLKADVVELQFGAISSTTQSLYNDFTSRLLSGYCNACGVGGKRLTRV